MSEAQFLTGLSAVRCDVDLSPLTTFGVHAVARFFARAQDDETLVSLYEAARRDNVPVLVLGGGSNILFTRDFDGLVVSIASRGVEVVDENDDYRFVRVAAGEDWSAFVDDCLQKGWCGLENLSLVPGTVGGAAVQNIGAYGVEFAERVSEVECLDSVTLQKVRLTAQECDYGYRTSVFKTDKRHLVVTAVTLALPKVFRPVVGYKEMQAYFADRTPADARELAEAVKAIRRRKLPDPKEIGSAGSFFKNPVVSRIKMVSLLEETPQIVTYPMAGGRAKLAAGWLIEAVGMKGKRVGDAAVYERQALVLVNYGSATGAQIKALADEVVFKVKRRFGVELEPEPVII